MKGELILFLLSICMFWSCSSTDGEDGTAFIEIKPETSFVYEYLGGCDTITVNSSREWEVKGETDWCTVTVLSEAMPQRVAVRVAETKEKSDRSATLTFVCGEKVVPISVKQYGSIETGYVDLGLENQDITFVYDENRGSLVVDYAKNVPSVRKGNAIVLPVKYGYAIRVIESVKAEGMRLTLQTSRGNMCHLFRNVDFTLATDRSLGDGNVFLPTQVGYLTPEGKFYELYNSSMNGRKVPDFFSYSKSFDNADLYNQNGNRLYWEKCILEAKLKGAFSFKFSEKEENRGKLGDLEAFSMRVCGDLSTDYSLKYDFKQSINVNEDKIVQQDFAQSYIFRFMVNDIPVVITTNAHLGKMVDFQVSSLLNGATGFKDAGTLEVKTEWIKGGEMTHMCTYDSSVDLGLQSLQTAGTFSCKAAYYPLLEFGMYNYDSQWLKPLIYLKEDMTSVAKEYGDTYYAWSSTTTSGGDLLAGGALAFANEQKEWESDVCHLKEEVLLEAPKKIRLVSPENGIEVTHNKNVEAVFEVLALNTMTGNYEPCANALVVFEAENGLSSSAVVADDKGLAKVSWKPETMSNKAVLKAILLGANAADVDNASLDISFKSTSTPGEPVDLGLSVKWSSCNLGANVPEEHGDCFAWGEMEEKSEYTWQSYSFWEDLNDDGGYTSCDEVENIGDISGTEYDIARSQWGGNWRMPTVDELKELLDECQWEWTEYNGVLGRKVTGPNGNSIFLPATGWRDENGQNKKNAQGYYWTGSQYSEIENAWHKACRLYFCSSMWRWEATYRYWGGFIRPVTK